MPGTRVNKDQISRTERLLTLGGPVECRTLFHDGEFKKVMVVAKLRWVVRPVEDAHALPSLEAIPPELVSDEFQLAGARRTVLDSVGE